MMVNNEIGTIEPIEEIGNMIKNLIKIFFFMWMPFKPMEKNENRA